MSPLSMFIPLTKVDAENRLVYGIATAEHPDRAGEVCDFATSKPHYEKWSNDIHAATGGLSKGNLRAMHGKIAAGKLTDIKFNDEAKQIEICAKVVDDQEWKKVEEGVYTGFSQGGSYVKKWKDPSGAQRYTAMPSEISLVDLPCLKTATFEMIKGAGLVEQRHFADAVTVDLPDNAKVLAKAAEIAKAAGREDVEAFLAPARDTLVKAALPPPEPLKIEEPATEAVVAEADALAKAAEADAPKPIVDAEVEQVWKAPDGATFVKKADAIAHAGKASAQAAARADAAPALEAIAGLTKRLTGGSAPRAPRLTKAAGADVLEKGLSQVSRLASIILDLVWLQNSVQDEATREGDGSAMPDTIKGLATQLGAVLVTMCGEEVGELFTPPTGQNATPDYDWMYMAAGKVPEDHVGALAKFVADRPELAKGAREIIEKLGARNSKADAQKIQAMHDHAVGLGATCGSAQKAAAADDLQKRADTFAAERDEALAKRDIAVAQHAALKEVVDAIPGQIAELHKAIKAMPVETRLIGRVVAKGSEEAGGPSDTSPEALEKAFAAMPAEQRALMLTKVSQSMPRHLLG